jgi:hypothetical protein
MVRPIDVEPLNRDTLVLLETDYPTQCDAAPGVLVQDPDAWTLVDKFCFFSGGPINTDEDVYYRADFDGNPIYMLAFLSPSLTPSELYKLDDDEPLASIAAVEEVESVYDLTERDFDDLKLYHLGPCRALYVNHVYCLLSVDFVISLWFVRLTNHMCSISPQTTVHFTTRGVDQSSAAPLFGGARNGPHSGSRV